MRRLIVMFAALIAAAALVPSAGAAATSPRPTAHDLPWHTAGPAGADLAAVSCWAPGTCIAVGTITSVTSEPASATLADGAWTSTVLPVPPAVEWGGMVALDCTGPQHCVGLGRAYNADGRPDRTFVEVLSGSTWTPTLLAAPAHGSNLLLNGISCPSSGSCTAVGSYETSTRGAPVVETLRHGSWTAAVPPVAGNADADLRAVDCSSSGSCVAVGQVGSHPLAETLSGGEWTESRPPAIDGAQESALTSVSCPAPEECTSVGWYEMSQVGGGHPFASSLSNGAWTSTAIPDPPLGLSAGTDFVVSCVTSTSCTAVGNSSDAAFAATLSAGTWSSATLPFPDGDSMSVGGVSCPATDSCLAVGTASNRAVTETLAGGDWAVAVVTLAGPPYASPFGVSCASSSRCIAVGQYEKASSRGNAFTETYRDSRWTAAKIAPQGDTYPEFSGISCPTANWCLALYEEDGDGTVYADRYSGGSWSVTPVPLPVYRPDSVSPPSCPEVGDCTFVASYETHGGAHKFVAESLSGATWSTVPLHRPKSAGAQIFDLTLSCPTTSWCAATGTYYASGGGGMFGETIDDGQPSVHTIRNPAGAVAPTLSGLSCAAPHKCTAVGRDANDVSDVWQPVVETLSGPSWTGRRLPLPAAAWNESLAAVSCVVPTECVAVGTYTNHARTAEHPLVATLTGGTWQPTVLANASNVQDADLSSVSCATGGSCRAVGDAIETDGGRHPISTHLYAARPSA